MAGQPQAQQKSQLRAYAEAIAVEVIAALVASGLGSLVVWIWHSKPLYVFLAAAVIVLTTVLLAARTVKDRKPSLKHIIPLTLFILLIAEASVFWFFLTQITRVPNLVGTDISQANSLIEEANLVGKISSAKCGDQENNITFQDLPPDSLVMKGSTIQAVTGIPTIEITSPGNSTEVSWKQVVTGKSCGIVMSGLSIYVLIHPLETDTWWVQPSAIIETDGQWRATCQFGENLSQGAGAEYEIIAITAYELTLGKNGVEPPQHLAHSQVVTVYKKR